MQSSLLSNTPSPSLNCESSSDEEEITLDEICDRNYELSLLERLPRELVMEIISFAPECVFRLRLTSRMFRAIVDDFAYNQGNAQIADEVMFTSFEWDSKKKTEVSAVVPKPIYKLFELRLLISLRALRFDFTKRIDRSFDKLDDHPNVYKLNYTSALDYGRMPLLQCLTTLIVSTYFLLSLSTLVRSLYLEQLQVFGTSGWSPKYFFGTHHVDWSATILRMFERRRLDALCIENPRYPAYLTAEAAEMLREGFAIELQYLPKTGKAVWFEATCSVYSDEGFAEVTNGHLVKGVTFDFNRAGSLSVKHFSRNEERLSKYE
ncbi:hypothetical protein PRIPAC_82071 [Pristionchus pacificus]|uniref:F-box domain-containing protein n=1 Tax=Pristionchus pacificus TaxID=54126 RepID=A0A2A6BH43_PRIPA|nr:hypothetical protein PRIPAC_82071 [Pristionchus pacificus]|eukprot:PDM65207.1 hypothetical protein PRIPAC_52149 [Pristionchus pacificus]